MTLDLSQVRGNRPARPPAVATHVYYLGTDTGGVVKIGQTVDLDRRLAALRRDRPAVGLHYLAIEPMLDTFLEGRRHLQFRTSRLSGEWFALTPELSEHIAALVASTR